MKISHVLFIWLSTLFATTQANKYAGGHQMLFMYYAYKIDVMTLGPGEDSRICPDLRAARGETEMPYFDEFFRYLIDPEKWHIYNSNGVGNTVDPNPDWGYKQLLTGAPGTYLKESVPRFRVDLLIPNLDQSVYGKDGNAPIRDILHVLSDEVQFARSRPAKDGVNVKDMLNIMKTCGDRAVEARSRDIHDFKIADFNTLFGADGAVTKNKILADGTQVKEFDREATAAKFGTTPELHQYFLGWSDAYGFENGWYDDKADMKREAIRHEGAMQATSQATRRISRSRLCGW